MKLLITEKPSQCRDIAAAMGYSKSGKFFRGSDIVCAPAVGHLLEHVEPEKVIEKLSWTDPSTLLPVPRDVPIQPIGKTKDALNDIKALMKEASSIIVATDPDREGEGIGREILDYLKWKGPVQRLWLIGGMDKTSIQKAMKSLKPGDETVGMYRAQQARAMCDWAYMLVTMATTAAGRHGCFGGVLGTGQGRESVVSVGRVQTPTLAMVVRRDLLIENFKPTDHFSIYLDIAQNGAEARLDYAPAIADADLESPFPGVVWIEGSGKDPKPKALFVDEALVDAFTTRVQELGSAPLTVERKELRKNPPKPFSLTTLQQAMNQLHKMTAKQTLGAAQELYEAGVLSYPRTERDLWPMQLFDEDAEDVIKKLTTASDTRVSKVASELKFPKSAPSCYTTKPQEHYALMPTRKMPDLPMLPEHQRNVWLVVARRYLECHLPAATGFKTTLSIEAPELGLVNDNPACFKTSKETITNPGWIAAFNEPPKVDDPFKSLADGDADLTECNATASQTTPPKRYTEATLIGDMKAASKYAETKEDAELLKAVTGIGTPATRDAVIEGLLKRGYIDRNKSNLISTTKGRDLVRHAHATLTQVEMTARWERKLSDIEGLNPSTACTARDEFVEAQAQFAEQVIKDCIARMSSTAKRSREAGDAAASAAGVKMKPTPKMIDAAKKVAERKKIPVPKGLMSDATICRRFLDEHLGSRESAAPNGGSNGAPSNGGAPSVKQVSFMTSIATRKGVELPPDVLSDRKKASAWIDANR